MELFLIVNAPCGGKGRNYSLLETELQTFGLFIAMNNESDNELN